MVYLFRGKRKRLLIIGLVTTTFFWSLISSNWWSSHVRYLFHLPSDEKSSDGVLYKQFKEYRPQYTETLMTLAKVPSNASSNDSKTENSLASEGTSLALVFQNKWVGFSEIMGYNCSEALFSTTKNNNFPRTVARKSNKKFINDSQNCTDFRRDYGFERYPRVTEEERTFPIAFIILFHSSLDQVIFLLRAIYRPHNVYCLSVDVYSGDEIIQAVNSVARCLPNVFLASKLETIVYAGFTRLMADIDCMVDLLKHPEPWKYIINMPGQQFPLRTNLELVRILEMLNGSNNIETSSKEKLASVRSRHRTKYIYQANNKTGKLEIFKTSEKYQPPPHGIELQKGSTYAAFSRAFVQFAVHHPIAHDFLEWNKNVLSPDEYFWSTLHHTGVVIAPGGLHENPSQVPFIASFAIWKGAPWICATKMVHKICILSPEDLGTVVKQSSLFVNKFYMHHHPAALHCLDEWLVNRTFAGDVLDLSVYKNRSASKALSSVSTSHHPSLHTVTGYTRL